MKVRRRRRRCSVMKTVLQGVAGGSEVFRMPRRAAVYLTSVKRGGASRDGSNLGAEADSGGGCLGAARRGAAGGTKVQPSD